jgi:hypothetical protein
MATAKSLWPLWRVDDFQSPPATAGLLATVIATFACLSALELALLRSISLAGRALGSPILAPLSSRRMLARRSLEICCMALLTALGLQAHKQLGGFDMFSLPGSVERALAYNPLCSRLALAQGSYQVSSLQLPLLATPWAWTPLGLGGCPALFPAAS